MSRDVCLAGDVGHAVPLVPPLRFSQAAPMDVEMDVGVSALTVFPSSYEKERAHPRLQNDRPPSESTLQRPRFHDQLTSLELATLSEKMLAMSKRGRWDTQVDYSGHEDTIVWGEAMGLLVGALAKTRLQSSIISFRDHFETHDFVGQFTDDELEEWKNGLRKAVKENDWTDLIDHRMFCITLEILIASHRCDSETSKERTIHVHRGDGSTN
jgi:hypothetical protein